MSRLRTLLVLLLTGSPVSAADWPQWLGPDRDGSTPEKVTSWKQPLRELWRQSVGEGNSSPVVVGERVFLHTRVKEKLAEQVTAYDAATGKPLWRTEYERGKFTSQFGNGPRATPAVVGQKIYTLGITGVLTCLNVADGSKVWQVDTWKEFNPPHLLFGTSSSPLVDSQHVYVMVGGQGTGVVAFDRERGAVAWKSLDDGPSYSSPIAVDSSGIRQVVFLTQKGLVSLKPDNGTVSWRYPFSDLLLESSTTPLRTGDMIVASSITLGSAGVPVESKAGQAGVAPLWKNAALTSYFSTPVAVGKEHFYMVTGTNPLSALNPLNKKKTAAVLNCVETTSGKVLWQRPGVGTYHASLLRTGNNKLLLLEERGALVLLAPDPQGYRELARSKVSGHTWAHPALAGGRLYVRDDQALVCLEGLSSD
jgi:outer membrane protein assembly factor BamB